jgi:hypothetical protein
LIKKRSKRGRLEEIKGSRDNQVDEKKGKAYMGRSSTSFKIV